MEPNDATVERRLIANRYALIAKLGEGGFGSVFLARDTLLMRDVAFKLLGEMSADRRERFFREARATARLKHPNIVGIYDAGEDVNGLYLVLEVVAGQSLRDLLPMPPDRALNVIRDVAQALTAAHAAGIVHRDIKPANILVDEHGRAKLADFGIAWVEGEQHVTVTGHVVGTPNYMAPEQLDGKSVGPEADLYALGIVMSELGLRDHPAVKRLLDPDPHRRGTAKQLVEELGKRPRSLRWLLWTAVIVFAIAIAAILLIRKPAAQPPLQHATVHLQRANASDIAKFADDLAGIPFTSRQVGPHDLEITASSNAIAAAKDAVRIIDALAGFNFKSDPNLFSGSKPSSRRISTTAAIPIGSFIALLAHAAGWPLVQDNSVRQVAGTAVPVALNNVPWDEAVRNVIGTLDLALWQNGEIWILESQQRRRERERTAPRSWVSFALHRRDRAAVTESLRPLLSEGGAVALSERTGLIIACDTADRLYAIRAALAAIDAEADRNPPAMPPRPYSGERLSLNVVNADLVQLIQLISKNVGLSSVIDPSVHGTVTVNLAAVPWDNSFDVILVSQGLSYSMRGKVISVFPESKVYSGTPVERTLHLRHEKPTFFRAFEKSMRSQREEIVIADDASGTLIVRGAAQVVDPTVKVFQTIDDLPPIPARFR